MRPLRIDGVFDIETAAWDRFLVGQVSGADGSRFLSWDEDELARHLLSRRGVYYAHAGGRFDCLWLLDWAVRHGYPWAAKMRGAGVLAATFGEGKERLEIRDSFALVPMALRKCAPMGTGMKIGLGLPCECGEGCDGYCALARPLSRGERGLVESYLDADCTATLAMLDALSARAARDGISLGLTVGGTAWATARAWLDLPKCEHSLARYKAIRRGYYGGRCEVYATAAPSGERYDIHSSYPAALSRVALPVGTPKIVVGAEAARAYAAGREGIFSCSVNIAPRYSPPLPVRMPERLLYPYGPANGTWTALELRHAESHGATIQRFAEAYVWSASEPRLAPFAERVWSLRDTAAREGSAQEKAFAAWYKWLANSLTGKLGQRPEHSSLSFVPSGDGAPEIDDRSRVVRVTRAGVYVERPTERVDACAHVEWSAYLTAEARTELHRQLEHAGPDAIYCDTDSVYSRRPLTRRIGDALGEWGHEGSLREWHSLAPKVYRYRDGDGETVVKGKGLSGLDADGYERLALGQAWTVDRGVDGLRTRLRASSEPSLFRRKNLSRSVRPVLGWVGGRELDGATGTRPTTVATYREREA